MGDVEKKLSPDGQVFGTANACEGFQLHCFPDIDETGSKPRRALGKDTECFQRSVPGAGDCHCGPPAADIEEPDQVLWVEEAEQLGYDRGLCEGEAKGRAEGQKDGLIKGRQAVQPVIDTLETLLDDLSRVRKTTFQHLESEIVELTMGVARKIVGHELAISPELVVTVVQRALGHLESAGSIRIKLNPDDIELINGVNADLCAGLSETATVSFESEPSIACGGCIIETDAGNIDARLETQFQAIAETFQDALSNDSKQE